MFVKSFSVIAMKILVKFAIFATFATFLISVSLFYFIFLIKLRKLFASKVDPGHKWKM